MLVRHEWPDVSPAHLLHALDDAGPALRLTLASVPWRLTWMRK